MKEYAHGYKTHLGQKGKNLYTSTNARILLKSIKAGETTVDLTGGEGGGNEANQPTEGQV